MKTAIEKALSFKPKSVEEFKSGTNVLRNYFDPETIGIENIDTSKPTLFVGNHTRYGFLDMTLIVREIYTGTGVHPRLLGDRAHFKIPFWRDFITNAGAAEGSREMCRALMQAGESIMVYPGGAREVAKGKGKNYELLWENRLGFVKMAAEAGYSITPFCSVGADDALDVVLDGEEILNSRLGKIVQKVIPDGVTVREDLIMPVSRGVGLTSIPRPEKFYFAFGKPIQTAGNENKTDDVKFLSRIQKKTADSVEQLLAETMLKRAKDRASRPLWRKLLGG